MPLLLIIGGVLILAGLSLLVAWFEAFLVFLKAILPLGVISLGGLLAYFGWEERQDRQGAIMDFSSPAEANRYQADALAYQESIDQIGEAETAESLGALDSLDSPVTIASPDSSDSLGSPDSSESLEGPPDEDTPHVTIESAPDDQPGATVTLSKTESNGE